MEFFIWAAKLAKANPWASGVLVVVVMAGAGTCLGILADLVFKALGINVGSNYSVNQSSLIPAPLQKPQKILPHPLDTRKFLLYA